MTTAVPDPHQPFHSPTPPSESTGPPPRVSRRKLLARIGCGTLTGGLAIGGGLTWAFGPGGPLSYEARRLRALKNDPMGAKTILGLTAVHTEESELPGWTTWKYPGVHLNRWFQDPSKPAEQLRNEFINYAEAHGWEKESRFGSPTSWFARHSHRDSNDYMELAIGLSQSSSTAKNTVLVVLDYD